jgi:hypothetical protein
VDHDVLQEMGARLQAGVHRVRLGRAGVQGLGDVSQLAPDPVDPDELAVAEPFVVCFADHGHEEVPVPATLLVDGIHPGQLGQASLSDGREHPEPGGRVVPGRGQHGLVDERCQGLGDGLLVVRTGADRSRCVELETVDEDRRLGPEPPVCGSAEVEGPLDAGGHGAVSMWPRARASAEELPLVCQGLVDLRGRQRGKPRGRELDGQRDALQLATDRCDSSAVALGQVEAGDAGASTVEEELNRLELLQPAPVRLLVRRTGQRGDRVHDLAVDPQRFTARRENADPRAVPQDRVGQPGHHVDDVLAVVQHEQEHARPQVLDSGDRAGLRRSPVQSQLAGDLVGNVVCLDDGAQRYEADAVREHPPEVCGHPQRESRLADAAEAGQGDEAGLRQPFPDRAALEAAAHECRHLGRKVARRLSAGESLCHVVWSSTSPDATTVLPDRRRRAGVAVCRRRPPTSARQDPVAARPGGPARAVVAAPKSSWPGVVTVLTAAVTAATLLHHQQTGAQ